MARLKPAEAIGARFGAVTCFFCSREFSTANDNSPRYLIEPHDGPGVYRARCRVACTLMPFVVPVAAVAQ